MSNCLVASDILMCDSSIINNKFTSFIEELHWIQDIIWNTIMSSSIHNSILHFYESFDCLSLRQIRERNKRRC